MKVRDGAGWPVTRACRRCGQRGEGFLHGHTVTPPPPKGSSSLCACEPLPSKPFEFEIMVIVFKIMVTVFPSPRATPTLPDTPTV